MLDNDYRMSFLYERIERLEQSMDVVEVQTCRRLVEYEERGVLTFLSDEVGKLDALVLTSREG